VPHAAVTENSQLQAAHCPLAYKAVKEVCAALARTCWLSGVLLVTICDLPSRPVRLSEKSRCLSVARSTMMPWCSGSRSTQRRSSRHISWLIRQLSSTDITSLMGRTKPLPALYIKRALLFGLRDLHACAYRSTAGIGPH